MKKNGFTLIELLVCFVLITAVSISLFKTVLVLQEKQKKNLSQNDFVSFAVVLNNSIQKDLLDDKITSYVSCGTNCYDITYASRGVVRLSINTGTGVFTYGVIKEKIPTSYKVYSNITFDITNDVSVTGEYNSFLTITIPLKSNYLETPSNIVYIYQFNRTTDPITT